MKKLWTVFGAAGLSSLALSGALALGAASVVIWQIGYWLHAGRWLALPVVAFVPAPVTSWMMIQRFADWIWTQPLSLVLLMFSAIFFFGPLAEAGEKYGQK